MAFWKQVLISLLVVVLAGAAWYFYFPGAQDVLSRLGVVQGPSPSSSGGSGGGPGGPGGRGGFGSRASTVVTEPAKTSTINTRLNALGDGVSAHSVTVTPSASGTLAEVAVSSGTSVTSGQVIAKLDAKTQQIAYNKAKLALDDAQAALERTRQLANANAATAVQLKNAQLAVDNARLALQSAQVDLEDRTITAPIAGTIGIVQVSAGNAVTTQTVIATIEDRSAIKISFWVPARFVGAIAPGDPVTAVPVARPEQTVKGTISAVDNKVDSASGTFEVQARIPNTDDSLRPGMAFTVSMSFPGQTYPAVNPLAVQWGSGGAYVWRASQGKAEQVNVRIVQRNTESVLVSGDIKAGDQIVTEGLTGLRPGAAVEIAGQAANDTAPASGNGQNGQNGKETGAPAKSPAPTGS